MKALLRPDRYRVTAWLLGALALVSPVLLLTQFSAGDEPDMLSIILWLVIPNAVAGFVLSWRFTDLPDPLGSRESPAGQRWRRAADRGLVDAVIVLLIQFAGVLAIQLAVSLSEDDWSDFFEGPLLITAIAGMALFLAVLIGLFLVAPVRMLTGWIGATLAGGRVDSSRPAVALLLLVVVPLAAMIVLAGYAAPHAVSTGGKAVAGIVLFAQVLFTVQGDAQQQVFAWIARALIVVLALDLVWIARIGMRRKKGT